MVRVNTEYHRDHLVLFVGLQYRAHLGIGIAALGEIIGHQGAGAADFAPRENVAGGQRDHVLKRLQINLRIALHREPTKGVALALAQGDGDENILLIGADIDSVREDFKIMEAVIQIIAADGFQIRREFLPRVLVGLGN